jgi:hypothetical protein
MTSTMAHRSGCVRRPIPDLSAPHCSVRTTGATLHAYSSYARGPEELIGTLMILDPYLETCSDAGALSSGTRVAFR